MTSRLSTADLTAFSGDPIEFFERSRRAMHTLPGAELASLQLGGLQLRFEQLRDRLPVLRTMADEQHIDELAGLDDAAALLFPHTVYKSYPPSLLAANRFDMLTTWLSRLTTVDVSHLDTSDLDSIDDWLDLLDAETELRLAHSSGTTGTMSFVPHTYGQWDRLFAIMRLEILPDDDGGTIDVVWPSFQSGRSGIARHAFAMSEQLAGSPDRFHALHPGLLSADVMYLAARLRGAAARGETGRIELTPAMIARKAEFDDALRATGAGMGAFVERLADTLRGERIVALSTWDTYYAMAAAGQRRGLDGVFAADSVLLSGGGTKGGVLPADWDAQVARFAGVPSLQLVYAMAEVAAVNLLCERGGYHIEPWVILYVLDSGTGQPLPRAGTQTGRAAFYDLTADVHWGGFVSGDEITVDWRPCGCGRTTPRVGTRIGRFSASRGGDDKISCAATDEALEEALEFLNGALA